MNQKELELLARKIAREICIKWMDEFFQSLQDSTELYLLEHPEQEEMVECFIDYIQIARQSGKGL